MTDTNEVELKEGGDDDQLEHANENSET